MTEDADPSGVTEALQEATDAFDETGRGLPAYEDGIETDADWKTQLTKSCKLLRAIEQIDGEGHHTASIELCFGTIERALEAFALAEGGDELRDFHDHTYSYDRASALGLLSPATTGKLEQMYAENRTDSYYGGKRPTREQATAMQSLTRAIHDHVTNQIREGGVCLCE